MVVDMIILLSSPVSSPDTLPCHAYWFRKIFCNDINRRKDTSSTYDHRLVRTGHPVRSAILKHQIGRLVVEWVTISEYLLLYVFWASF